MGKIEDISSWINTKKYTLLLDCLSESQGLRINYGPVPEVLLQFDVDSLRLSELEVTQISNVAANTELVCSYVREKLKSLEGTEDEQEGKHPEDEDDIDVEEGPFSETSSTHIL